MEDPITFDVWAVVRVGCIEPAVAAISEWQPDLSTLQLRVLINRSVTTQGPMLLVANLGWREVQALRRAGLPWASDIEVYQHGGNPGNKGDSNFCKSHQLVYGHYFGCPICTGFYEPYSHPGLLALHLVTCPPAVSVAVLDILTDAILSIRIAGQEGEPAYCAIEANHIHNLPDLLANYHVDKLRYYLTASRPHYLYQLSTLGPTQNHPSFAEPWRALEQILFVWDNPAAPSE